MRAIRRRACDGRGNLFARFYMVQDVFPQVHIGSCYAGFRSPVNRPGLTTADEFRFCARLLT